MTTSLWEATLGRSQRGILTARGPFSNRSSRDGDRHEPQLDAPVRLAALGGRVVGDRIALAEALRQQPALVDALRAEVARDGRRAIVRERVVEAVRARAVRVTHHLDDRL